MRIHDFLLAEIGGDLNDNTTFFNGTVTVTVLEESKWRTKKNYNI